MITINVKKSNKCNGQYSLFISFPYDQSVVNLMREQLIRYWHPDEKEWEIPLNCYPKIIKQLEGHNINIVDSHKILANLFLNRFNNKLYT